MNKDADHWAFLEDFEAPMWVDLTVEAKLSNKEIDDDWFHKSHKFHQLPSKKLKAAFKHIESGGKLEIDVGGSSSPKISSSVSKARGKYYANDIVGIDFRLSLSGKECLTKDTDDEALQSQCGNEIGPKSSKDDSTVSSHLDQEDDGSGKVALKLSNTSSLPSTKYAIISNCLEHKVGVSDSKSSMTSDRMLGAEVVIASNHIIGRRSELLSVIKHSLRKSCTTRIAVRGQTSDGQQLNGFRASFGKSSVGSCSVHSQDAKDIIAGGTQRVSRTPESKHMEKHSQESKTKNKVKTSTCGSCQSVSNGDIGVPLKTNAKPGSLYPHLTLSRDRSTASASMKINTIDKCGNRGKVGMPKNLKTSSATRPAQCDNGNGSFLKLGKSASSVNTVPKQFSNCRKITVRKDTMASISEKDSVSEGAGKSVVTKPSQPLKVTVSKVPPSHRRPLAPVNLNGDGLNRRPLAPTKQINQGSLPFARKTTMKGKSDVSTKSFGQGKENTVSNFATNKRRENGKGIAARGVAETINRMKLTEARKNNVREGLVARKPGATERDIVHPRVKDKCN